MRGIDWVILAIWGALFAGCLAFWTGIIWVAVHFIRMYW